MSDKSYIGDSVYVESQNGMIRLTTFNGIVVSNEIFLELEVFDALTAWVERQLAKKEQPPPATNPSDSECATSRTEGP